MLFPDVLSATECTEPVSEFVDLSSDNTPNVVLRTLAVFEDPDGTASYESILRADRDGKFRWHCRADLEPGPKGSALWVRLNIRLAQDAPADWVFTFGSSQIDEARLYQSQPGGLFSLKRTGRAVPRDTRDMVSRWPAIGLALQDKATTTIFVRLSGVTAPFTSLELVPAIRYADREAVDLLTLAAVLGFMIAMLAYNIVIYIRSRLHQCLYYFLYIGFIILHVVIYDGLLFRFSDLRLTGSLSDGLAQFSGLAAAICILMFGRALLRLRTLAPRMDGLVLISIWLVGISFAVE